MSSVGRLLANSVSPVASQVLNLAISSHEFEAPVLFWTCQSWMLNATGLILIYTRGRLARPLAPSSDSIIETMTNAEATAFYTPGGTFLALRSGTVAAYATL